MTKYSYDYPRPALTTDMIIFSYHNNKLLVLLIQRKFIPFKGKWAFPGGFVDIDETAEECANRELREETGLQIDALSQLITVSTLGRDPRGRTVTVFFYGFISYDSADIQAGDDAKNARWFPVDKLPPLAFDHSGVIQIAMDKLKELILLNNFGRKLLPEYFALSDLEQLFYNILKEKEITGKYIDQYSNNGIIRRIDSESGLYSFNQGQ